MKINLELNDQELEELMANFKEVMTDIDALNRKVEQIIKHLNKIVDVAKLVDLTEGSHIERELMLIKVKATGAQRAEVKRVADIFRGDVVDVTPTMYTIQLTGTSEKLDGFIQALQGTTILEVARTGVSGVARGEKVLSL